ncbi:MAG: ABC transporter ATP-binding protein, partial [Thermoanaerobacterium sp.]|nr:ABC transporter ATP-binding protein [Thermoanaerobacterium sp.]
TPPLNVMEGKVYYKIDEEFIDIFSLGNKKMKEIRWEYISYIPQGSMSVLNPVEKVKCSFEHFIKAHRKVKNKEEIIKPVEKHLTSLGLPIKVLESYPHQLSGGMRQRITVALATIMQPKIIVADEPTTALDVVMQRAVIQLLKDIQSRQKNTIILVTHDMGIHANIANRIGIMYAGKIIEEASTVEIFENPMHPYTKYLIGSLPKIGDKSYKISAPGSPPSLINLPDGCRFYPRCERATEKCAERMPRLIEIKPGHRVACFLYSEAMEE